MGDKMASSDEINELGRLLQKDRPEDHRRQLEKILQQSISTRAKIRLIEKMDRGENEGTPVKRPSAPETPPAPPTPETTDFSKLDLERVLVTAYDEGGGPSLSMIQKNRDMLIRPVTESGFFAFFFFEMSPILNFGHNTGTIYRANFWTLKLTFEAWNAIMKHWRQEGDELYKLLSPLLESAWLHLSKHQYNTLVAFQNFAKALASFSQPTGKNLDSLIITILKPIEKAYFTLIRDPETFDILHTALESIGRRDYVFRASIDRIATLERRILHKGSGQPTVESILLACHMLKARKVLNLNQILEKGTGPVIPTAFFEGNPELQKKIQSWLLENEKRLIQLIKARSETFDLNTYLPPDTRDDYAEVEVFYNWGGKLSFQKDLNSPPTLYVNFSARLIDAYRPILTEPVGFLDLPRTLVFQPQVFSHEFSKLDLTAAKVSKLLYQTSGFNRKHFQELRARTKLPTGFEAGLLQSLDEGSTLLMTIAKKLMDILRLCGGFPQTTTGEAIDGRVFQGRPIPVPCLESHLVDGIFSGRVLRKTMELGIVMCLKMAYIFQESSLMSSIRSQEQWDRDLKSIFATVERIAPLPVVRYFHQKYDF